MPITEPVSPKDINNDDQPFLFQEDVFIGLDAEQINVRKSIRENKSSIETVKQTVEQADSAANELKTRVGNVEKDAQSNKTLISAHIDNVSVHVPAVTEEIVPGSTLTVSGDKKAVWNKDTHAADLKSHTGNAEIHVSEELRKHPENATVHLPKVPGSDGEVLVYEDGIPKPKRLNADAFEGLQLDVSAATIARAFSSYLTKSWSMPTSPFRQNLADPERVLAAKFLHSRFVLGGGGNDGGGGMLCWSHDGRSIRKIAESPFEKGAVVGFAGGYDKNQNPFIIAINEYNSYSIGDGTARSWTPGQYVFQEEKDTVDENDEIVKPYNVVDFADIASGNDITIIVNSSGRSCRIRHADIDIGNPEGESEEGNSGLKWDVTGDVVTARNLRCIDFGNGEFWSGGQNGKLANTTNGLQWTEAPNVFGNDTVLDIAFNDGNGAWCAVGTGGKAAIRLKNRDWKMVATPFGTENITCVFSGGGVFVLFTATGKGAVTADGETFDLIDTETPVSSAVRCGCSGNSSFLIGTDRGEIILSVSLAQLFATVSQGDFQQYTDETDAKVDKQIGEIKETHENFVEEANRVLSRKPNLGLPYSLPVTCHLYEDGQNFPEPCEHLDDDGEPLLDSGGFPYAADAYCPKCFPWNMIDRLQSGGLSTQRAAPEFHFHSDENLVRKAWLGRPTPTQQDPRHPMTGVATLDHQGKLPVNQATWMRDAASGIAALDANRRIYRDYLPTNYDVDLLMNALRGGMVENWFLINNPIFEDTGGFSRIYAIDSIEGNVVMVGDKGRIAHGPNARALALVESPFGDEPVIDVKFGVDDFEQEVCVAISQSNAISVSRDGGKTWSELTRIDFDGVPADFEGLCFGARKFLIHCSNGDVLTLHWDEDGKVTATKQDSSPNITQGLYRIRWCVDKFIGVGVNGKIVTSINGSNWQLETTFTTVDLHDVLHCNGVNVAVGVGGALGTSPTGISWTKRDSRTTSDLYAIWHSFGMTVVVGRDTILSSFNVTASWERRTCPFSGILRCCHSYGQSFLVGTDNGQIGISATYLDILGIILEVDIIALSDEYPLPVAKEAHPGFSPDASRSDHQHSIGDMLDGVLTEEDIGVPGGVAGLNEQAKINEKHMPWERGKPNGVASLDENGRVPDSELAKGLPNGVPPLGPDNIVPKPFLPPCEIDLDKLLEALARGGKIEFYEQPSCFYAGPLQSSILYDGEYAFGKYFLCGERGIGFGETVTDWQLLESQPFGEAIVQGMAVGKDDLDRDVLVAIDTDNRVSFTHDGFHWSVPEILGDYDFEDICYYNRTFTVLCSNGHILRSFFIEGTPLWEEQASSPNVTARLNKIRGGNGVWLAVGNDGRMRRAIDASHFKPLDSPTAKDFLALCYGQGRFLYGGADGVLFTTTDGIESKPVANPFKNDADITALCFDFDEGIFCVCNRNGEIATTDDLETWTIHVSPLVMPIRAAYAALGRIVLGDDEGKIAVSRKDISVITVGGGKCDCRTKFVALGVKIDEDVDGKSVVQLLNLVGGLPKPNGAVVRGVVMVKPGTETEPGLEEILRKARTDNPVNFVEII